MLSYIGDLKKIVNQNDRATPVSCYRGCWKTYQGKTHVIQVSHRLLKKTFPSIQKNTCVGVDQLSFILLGCKSVSSYLLLALFSSLSPLFSFPFCSFQVLFLTISVFQSFHLILVLFHFLLPICPSPKHIAESSATMLNCYLKKLFFLS